MRRQDVKKVLVIGSGPIVIGQAAEFDYSGTQSLLALREEGLEVVLLNSNPASVMTDPELADRTYVEPVTAEFAELVLEREGCDAILPTMGGQTALNVAKELAESGVLARLGVRLLGSPLEAIRTAEDRALFKDAMIAVGLPVPRSFVAKNEDQARGILAELGLPLVLRPSFTLGGTGGGIARTEAEYFGIVKDGLLASPSSTILIEESVLGWKEFELEVLRDVAGNAIVVCSIENIDAMGVHTGDSITVAPSQTLTDKEYQRLRNAAFAVLEAVGIEGGGANVQFAVNPVDGRYIIVEMNPRVSRSSALASKATGYPIAKVATKLALGYHLPEIGNAITKTTSAAFEPAIDYVVVKAPRFDFEKFPEAPRELGTQMRSVGEAMALGRNLREAYQKALRSLERRGSILVSAVAKKPSATKKDELLVAMARPTPERAYELYAALHHGAGIDEIARASGIDPYFVRHLEHIVGLAHEVQRRGTLGSIDPTLFYQCKESGLADAEIAALVSATEQEVRLAREAFHLRPRFRAVDTCAGEFAAHTPYFYSGYDHPTGALPVHEGDEDVERPQVGKGTVIVLGSGPIRIGQGVEFDYACVHAVSALRQAGYRAVMVNSNPETVSTDFDVADRLYFEPLTLENVLEIVVREKPLGVFVQFGGQAPLKLAKQLAELGVPVLGTSPDSIDLAEDRERFAEIVRELGLRQPEGGMARSVADALVIAGRLGYPVLVRPSYVLGGRAMRIVHDDTELRKYAEEAVDVSAEHPVLVDKFLHHATEVDVDVVADAQGNVIVGGFLEHVEEAGVHSGDAACIIPPVTLSAGVQERMRDAATALARRLGVVGLLNVQFAVIGKTPFVLEANPRASRTVPFVAKATGLPLARWAARAMMGETLPEMGAHERHSGFGYAVKESVFPFSRFANADVLLGPEMKSTGEVMGAASTAAEAFAKAALAAGANLSMGAKNSAHGRALLFVSHDEKPDLVAIARRLAHLGLTLTADRETAEYLGSRALTVEIVPSDAASLLASLEAGDVALLVATRKGVTELRRAALAHGVPYATTLEGANMYSEALLVRRASAFQVQSLQERAAVDGLGIATHTERGAS